MNPVARFLVGKNTFLGGMIFVFNICLKQMFPGTTQYDGHKNIWVGSAAISPWLRACMNHLFQISFFWFRAHLNISTQLNKMPHADFAAIHGVVLRHLP